MNQKPLRVHEADDYLETGNAAKHPTTSVSRARSAFPPLVVGLMVGCIALAITELLRRVAPDWNGTYFLLVPIVAAFAGHTTYRVTHERYRSGSDRLRLQIIELAVIFLVLKAASYLDNTLPEVWNDIRRWPEDIATFFDLETIAAFALACAAWFSAARTARDLEAVADPMLYKGETGPMERLNRRFLAGGLILLFISGLARIEFATLLEADRSAIHGLALNVLVYFVLGLLVLGQVRLTWHSRLWEQQKYKVSGALNKAWLKYTLLFLLIALAIAVVLPTQYAVGLFDIAGFVVSAVAYIAVFVFTVIVAVLQWLFSLFFKPGAETEPLPEMLPPSITVEPPQPANSVHLPWLALARSILFWIVALGAVGYVVYSYLKDRPELVRAFKAFKVTQIAQKWWRALRTWWRDARRTLRATLPTLSLNFLRRKERRQETRAIRRKHAALREQMLDVYLETLDRAREEGFPRRDAQTPYEYHHALDPHLPEAHTELSALTEAFVEARYSAHPVDADDVAHLHVNARRVHAALDKLHAESLQPSVVSHQQKRKVDG